jgi:hypothetical protein
MGDVANPDAHLAENLISMMDEAAKEALLEIGNKLKERVIADIPKGDPTLDPDPKYALADHVTVSATKHGVTVTVAGKYVIKQHERMTLQHPRGGRAKFLERNAVTISKEVQGKLSGTVKRKFAEAGRGGRTRTSITPISAEGAGKVEWTG